MAISLDIPGHGQIELEHLLLDQNGTLSFRGDLIGGVAEKVEALSKRLNVYILTADTFGTLDQVTATLGVGGARVKDGVEKAKFAERLGASHCAAIGNGANDVKMLRACELAIAILGPEGMSSAAANAAHIVCPSILTAFDILLDERLLIATLRG